MLVKDIMQTEVVTISPLATLREAMEKMRARKVKSLVVERRDAHDAFGIVTYATILRTISAEEGDIDLINVYDVCHNIAKEERHRINGSEETVLVHRKGATRAFPAGRPEVPEAYRSVGQPVFIPGSMGSSSYVLCGGERSLDRTFGSTAHGAGRVMSRTQAKAEYSANELQRQLREQGIYVRARSGGTLVEEAPGAYKDVDEVIRVSDALGIGTKVARTHPIANIKG